MARTQDLTFSQGTDANLKLFLKDTAGVIIDLNSKQFSGNLKKSYTTTEDAIPFTVNIVDANNGIITLGLTSTQTAALDHQRRYVYDLMMYESGNTQIEVIVEGKVFVKPTVTRIG